MPSANDIFNKLLDIEAKLAPLHNDLVDVKNATNAVKSAVDAGTAATQAVNATLANGFSQLITLGAYTNQALSQNAKQNDTMICILEHISENTCRILNEAHVQTGLQTAIKNSAAMLADLYATVHADAALQRERLQKLQAEIEACCPPPRPEPACRYEPCKAPGPLPEPPKVPQPSRPIG